ncbi:FadR/GntR family transcriptional regulator [Embleya scabrispora]|uniref:FadR/GntR family transcriptional regulator n=1 Tax=Embleya scabrispora TaxID=159449 RepID=UPI000381AD6A|nr:FadR/GntR family transcriptional regulator [Embleya scabrispora]MYS86574.1 FCD domain-containing protein [Streptomyces sp. SID5474]
MPKPIQRQSLTDMAVDALIDLIEERGLSEGDALPATAELADELSVSRPVIREAIAELAGQGLLERRQGRETVVTLPGSRQLERLLRLRFAVTGTQLEDIQTYREVAEVGAARLAALKATDADIEAIQQKLDAIRAARSDEELHEADQAFHREVARAAGNGLLLLTIDGITPHLHQLRVEAWRGWTESGKGIGPIVEAHAVILDRIRRRDPEAAARAMREHLGQAREGLVRLRGPRRQHPGA